MQNYLMGLSAQSCWIQEQVNPPYPEILLELPINAIFAQFLLKTKCILVGNGEHVSELFVIPIIIDLYGGRFGPLLLKDQYLREIPH